MSEDTLDALEARALDDPEALRSLLAALSARLAHPALLVAEDGAIDRAIRVVDLIEALAIDPRSLGEAASEHAAIIARHLAREQLDEQPASAVRYLHHAERWQRADGSGPDRAAAKADLAMALSRLSDAARSESAWNEALALARQLDPSSEKAWLVKQCADALAATARARGDDEQARALEQESDAADDEDLRAQRSLIEPALRFFTASWDGDTPPPLRPHSAWIERSTGLIQRGSEDPTCVEGLRCERVFGNGLDFVCSCGAVSGRASLGVVCDRCGVESMRAARMETRIGHIALPVKILHPAAMAKGPEASMIALALDLSDDRLALVMEGRRCLRRASDAPRGADTLEPGSTELRDYDQGLLDPSITIGAGEDAVLSTIEALDAAGAARECAIERKALEAHRASGSAAGRARLRWLAAREQALDVVARWGADALVIDHVPALSPRWIDAQARACELREAYVRLVAECERSRAAWGDDGRAGVRDAVTALCAAFAPLR